MCWLTTVLNSRRNDIWTSSVYWNYTKINIMFIFEFIVEMFKWKPYHLVLGYAILKRLCVSTTKFSSSFFSIFSSNSHAIHTDYSQIISCPKRGQIENFLVLCNTKDAHVPCDRYFFLIFLIKERCCIFKKFETE